MEELKKILKDTTKCALLDHYLIKSKNIVYLKFILEVEDYKQSYEAQDENWRQDLAQEIFRRYIQKNAKNYIELIPSVIDDITKSIKMPKADLFVGAYNAALKYMADNVLPDFLNSDIYKNYRGKSSSILDVLRCSIRTTSLQADITIFRQEDIALESVLRQGGSTARSTSTQTVQHPPLGAVRWWHCATDPDDECLSHRPRCCTIT